MKEVAITCRTCGTENLLSETLAQPYIDAAREKMDREAQERASVIERREDELNRQSQELADLRLTLHAQAADIEAAVERRLGDEREMIAAAESAKAEERFKAEVDDARKEQESQRAKIAELESAELDYRRDKAAFVEEKRQLDLTLARQLDHERDTIRAQAIEDQKEAHRIELEGREQALREMRDKLQAAQLSELHLRQERTALEEERQALDLQISRRLDEEREKIRSQAIQDQLESHRLELRSKDQVLSDLNAKLLVAQQAELDVRQARQKLEAEKQEFELEMTRRIDEERQQIREATLREEDERHRLKLAEKEKVIEDMRKQVEELRRKSDQGSQQLQGEVQEIELETVLEMEFPRDEFEPVPVGRAGSDVLQRVICANGLDCGSILWESKRTKGWNDNWLAKNREDQRTAGAQLGVIVSTALPNGVDGFDRKDGVWVTSFRYAVPLARTLRQLMIETAMARIAGEDREGKTNRVYSYVTGQEFRQRVSGMLEAYMVLREEIEAEKRSHKTRWARQERSLDLLLDGVGRMYGDLQGLVGKSMPEVDGLDARQIEALPANAVDGVEDERFLKAATADAASADNR